jgi:hypothetical protein
MMSNLNQNELTFPSDLDSRFTVAIIFPESDKYCMVTPLFSVMGHAFLLHERNMIVVDGGTVESDWFTGDHLLVIQAHEIGHQIANHAHFLSKGQNDDEEREADWLGYHLLLHKGFESAAELHKEEYMSRYHSDPSSDLSTMSEKLICKLVQTSRD